MRRRVVRAKMLSNQPTVPRAIKTAAAAHAAAAADTSHDMRHERAM